MERKRLIADRFRRIWYVVEHIAEHPGCTRRELANTFHLSERQIQADLNIVRSDVKLPLIRRVGYRFVSEGLTGEASAFTVSDAQLLLMILRRAMHDRSLPRERLDGLLGKLATVFPAHLQPLVDRAVTLMIGQPSSGAQVFVALMDAMLRGAWVELHYPDDWWSYSTVEAPLIRPELLLPYRGGWYVLGACKQTSRMAMLQVDALTAVTAVIIETRSRTVTTDHVRAVS